VHIHIYGLIFVYLALAKVHFSAPLIPSSKLRWQWNIPPFVNREYIFNKSIFHCHVSLRPNPRLRWRIFSDMKFPWYLPMAFSYGPGRLSSWFLGDFFRKSHLSLNHIIPVGFFFPAGCHGEVDIGGQLLVSVGMVNGENKHCQPRNKKPWHEWQKIIKHTSNQQINANHLYTCQQKNQ